MEFLLSLLLSGGPGERDLVHLRGSAASRAENMLLRSHLIFICHSQRSRASAPCCPLASAEPSVASTRLSLIPTSSTAGSNSDPFYLFIFPPPLLHQRPCYLFVPRSSSPRDLPTITYPLVGQLKNRTATVNAGKKSKEGGNNDATFAG